MTAPDEKPIKVDSGPRPEDGDQSTVSQDPNDDYSDTSKEESS